MPHREEARRSELFARFESMGEVSVRLMDPGTQVPPSEDVRYSRVWLAMRDAAKRDAREDRTLKIAILANVIATIAAVIAIVPIIITKLS